MPFDSNNTEKSTVVRGSRHRRLLSESIQLEDEITPRFVKPTLLVIAILVVVFVGWSYLVDIKEVAHAPGEVIPSGSVKIVEHAEGGTVVGIHVTDGQLVEKGQALVTFDDTQALSDLRQMEARYAGLRLRAERLSAFVQGRTPDFSEIGVAHPSLVADQQEIFMNQLDAKRTSAAVIESQIEQRRREITQLRDALSVARDQQQLTSQMVEMRQKMVDRKLIPRMEFLETKRAKVSADGEVTRLLEQIEVNQQTLNESRRRLADLDAQLKRQNLGELGTVTAEIAEIENAMNSLRNRVAQLDLKAPASGLVQDLKVVNEGQVVEPGGLVMNLVPIDQQLISEVKITTRDIGHVKVGQEVLVKVSSYDYGRFGGIKGKLESISPTSFVEEGKDPYFKGKVTLEQSFVGDEARQFYVRPGMGVQAEIITGEKTLLAYLLKPISDAVDRAFSER